MSSTPNRSSRSPLPLLVLAGLVVAALIVRFDVGGLGRRLERAVGVSGWVSTSECPAAAAAGSTPTLCVSRSAIVAYVQLQTQTVRFEDAEKAWDDATQEVRRQWLDRYVREEALGREARAQGVADAGAFYRERIVAPIESAGADDPALAVGDAEIEALFRSRPAWKIRKPETFRFAHVFVNRVAGLEMQSMIRAGSLRDQLNAERIPFDEAYPWGDPCKFARTYLDRPPDEIDRDFGEGFSAQLRDMKVESGVWQGPFESKRGIHLIMLESHSPAVEPTLESASAGLREELLAEKRAQAIERAVQAIVAKYEVELRRGVGVTAPGA